MAKDLHSRRVVRVRRFIPNEAELLFAVLICMSVQKMSRVLNSPRERERKREKRQDAKKKNDGGRNRGRRREEAGTLVNLKRNLDSVSPAYGFYTCRHSRTLKQPIPTLLYPAGRG